MVLLEYDIETGLDYYLELEKSFNGLGVILFHAVWSVPCEDFLPLFASVAERYPHLNFARLDVNKCPDVVKFHDIRSIPTLHFYRETVKVSSFVGADLAKLEDYIQRYSGPPEQVLAQMEMDAYNDYLKRFHLTGPSTSSG